MTKAPPLRHIALLTIPGLGVNDLDAMPTLKSMTKTGTWFSACRSPSPQHEFGLASLLTGKFIFDARPEIPYKTVFERFYEHGFFCSSQSLDFTAFTYFGMKPGSKRDILFHTPENGVDLANSYMRAGRQVLFQWSKPFEGRGFDERHLRPCIDELEATGMLEETLVVLTSTHAALENSPKKTTPLAESTLRVPLLFWTKNGVFPARTIEAPVSTLDIVPTLMSLFKFPYPKSRFHGVDLSGLLTGAKPATKAQRYYFAGGKFAKGKYLAAGDGRTKLLVSDQNEFSLHGTPADPTSRERLICSGKVFVHFHREGERLVKALASKVRRL